VVESLTLSALMDYHIRLFDYQTRVQWMREQNGIVDLSTKHVKNPMATYSKRVYGEPEFLNDVAEVRRMVMRFDDGIGSVVFFVRVSRVRSSTIVVDFLAQRTR
jgi:hypothetical protein